MDHKKLHILLADDDLDDCHFFEKALKELPLSTHFSTVYDGYQLMELLLDENVDLPDVLFLDINMPRKSGTECLTEMKQHKRLINLPIVMFSTSNAWDTINMLFRSGANVYIHKPNDFSQLKQVIHHALPISTENIFPKSHVKYILNA